jgi:hypothetical protein
LSVSVDPEDVIEEGNENNNEGELDIVVETSSGSGGSGSRGRYIIGPGTTTVPVESGEIEITRFQRFVEIEPGETAEIPGKILNTLHYNLENVTFALSGDVNPSWYSIDPEYVDVIDGGKNLNFVITFSIPEDALSDEYDLGLEISGNSVFGDKTFNDEMKLLVMGQNSNATATTTSPEFVEIERQKTLISGMATFVQGNLKVILLALLVIVLVVLLALLVKKMPKIRFVRNSNPKDQKYDYAKSNGKKKRKKK